MYYIDCGCMHHDIWKEFDSLREAEKAYENQDCKNKILYQENLSGFMTLKIQEVAA